MGCITVSGCYCTFKPITIGAIFYSETNLSSLLSIRNQKKINSKAKPGNVSLIQKSLFQQYAIGQKGKFFFGLFDFFDFLLAFSCVVGVMTQFRYRCSFYFSLTFKNNGAPLNIFRNEKGIIFEFHAHGFTIVKLNGHPTAFHLTYIHHCSLYLYVG